MKKPIHYKPLFLAALAVVFSTSVFSQTTRYIDELFPDVSVESQAYGQGVYIFTPNVEDVGIFVQSPSSDNPVLGDLNMEVYTPENDSETSRAAVIVLHTGNFLPRYFNGSTTGSRQDSSVVTLCKELAQRGYVAFAVNYRLGWNPLSSDLNVRKSTLLNAVYRGLHDVKTAVRHLKRSVNDGNPYGIDPDKITLFGFGTGGYLASNYGALDRVEELQIQKFVDNSTGDIFVDTALVGNVDGSGGNPAVNVVNHYGYCNDVMVCVNAGGAVGDSTWIEAGETPVLSFHCPDDPFAPFIYGTVIVPTTGDVVVPVSGSRYIVERANELGNNDVFAGPYTDPFSVAAQAALESNHPKLGLTASAYQGLFPFIRPTVATGREEASPWDFWDPLVVQATIDNINGLVPVENQIDGPATLANSLNNNPDMSPSKGKAYIDSIVGYMCPRLVEAMAVAQEPANCVPVQSNVGIEEVLDAQTSIFPNPAESSLTINTTGNFFITSIDVYNATGTLVSSETNLNTTVKEINVADLPTALYLVQITTDKGVITKKVMVK